MSAYGPPPGGYDPRYPPPRRARSHGARDDYYGGQADDYYDQRGRGGRSGGYNGPPPPYRSRRNSAYAPNDYSSDEDSPRRRRDRSRGRDDKRGRSKSKARGLVEGLGLGGIAGAVIENMRDKSRDRRGGPSYDRRNSDYGGYGDSRRRGRSYDRYDDRYDRYDDRRGSGRSRNSEKKWQQAATAAAWAGAVEAFRVRKEPGAWTGDKGKRIATAALAAGGLDGVLDRNPNRKGTRHVVESIIGGLASNRIVNGPRSRSRSRGRY